MLPPWVVVAVLSLSRRRFDGLAAVNAALVAPGDGEAVEGTLHSLDRLVAGLLATGTLPVCQLALELGALAGRRHLFLPAAESEAVVRPCHAVDRGTFYGEHIGFAYPKEARELISRVGLITAVASRRPESGRGTCLPCCGRRGKRPPCR